jgi:hypothetical protein
MLNVLLRAGMSLAALAFAIMGLVQSLVVAIVWLTVL